MAEDGPTMVEPSPHGAALPWRGPLALALLAALESFRPLLIPTSGYSNAEHYVPQYVLLGLVAGCAMAAIRSVWIMDRVCGVFSLIVSGGTVAYTAWTLVGLIHG